MKKDKKNELSLRVMLNGLDFINEAVRNSIDAKNKPMRLKYAILHSYAGLQLIFKARLEQEHWFLLFEDTGTAHQSKLQSGDFKSVDSNEALKRLENVCGVRITKAQKEIIKDIQKQRNKIEHYSVQGNIESLKSKLASILSFVIDFIDNNFDIKSLSEEELKIYKETKKNLRQFKEFVLSRLSSIAKITNNRTTSTCSECQQETILWDTKSNVAKCLFCNHIDQDNLITCPSCKTDSLYLDGWNVELICLKCEYSNNPEDIATEYQEEIMDYCEITAYMDGDMSGIPDCGECAESNIIEFEETYICLSCHSKYSSDRTGICEDCNSLYHLGEYDYTSSCNDCISARYG